MKKTPLFMLAAALATLLAAAPSARAGDYTFPKDTTPAFTFHTPGDWVAENTDPAFLTLKSADSTGVVTVIIVGNSADAVKTPLDDFARQVFDAAQIKNIDKTEAATLAGIKGKAYYGSVTKPDGTVVNIKITIIYIDGTHVGAVTRCTTSDITKATFAATDKVISTVKLLPAK